MKKRGSSSVMQYTDVSKGRIRRKVVKILLRIEVLMNDDANEFDSYIS
jgi:hypothetical protein